MTESPSTGNAAQLGLHFFEQMLRTRAVEDEVQRIFAQGLVRPGR